MMKLSSLPFDTKALDTKVSPVDGVTGLPLSSKPLIGEFDKDLKKNIEQLMQSGAIAVQQQSQSQPLPELKLDAAALNGDQINADQTKLLADAGASPLVAKSLDSLLASVPVQPAHSQSGKVKLPAGMVPVHESLTPTQMEVLGKQLEAQELAMNGEAELVNVKQSSQLQAPSSKAKKALSSEDFLQARSVVNAPAPDTKNVTKPLTQSPNSLSELNVGLAALGAAKKNSDSSQSGEKKDSKDQDQQLSKLAQNLAASPLAKAAGFDAAMTRVETTGNVVPGSLGTQRLSHDAVQTLGNNIQSFTGNGSGGEMRLRLKPDQLGEVFIQVSTLGNKVDLKVRASDDNAKRIIEESLSALKDQLGVHQLSLGSIDVSTAPAPTQAQAQSSAQYDLSQSNQFNLSDSTSQQSGHEARQGWEKNESRGDSGERLQRTLAQAAMNASGLKRSQANQAAPGRLNVMA